MGVTVRITTDFSSETMPRHLECAERKKGTINLNVLVSENILLKWRQKSGIFRQSNTERMMTNRFALQKKEEKISGWRKNDPNINPQLQGEMKSTRKDKCVHKYKRGF